MHGVDDHLDEALCEEHGLRADGTGEGGVGEAVPGLLAGRVANGVVLDLLEVEDGNKDDDHERNDGGGVDEERGAVEGREELVQLVDAVVVRREGDGDDAARDDGERGNDVAHGDDLLEDNWRQDDVRDERQRAQRRDERLWGESQRGEVGDGAEDDEQQAQPPEGELVVALAHVRGLGLVAEVEQLLEVEAQVGDEAGQSGEDDSEEPEGAQRVARVRAHGHRHRARMH
mgnify:CR=1 FL=1